MGSRTAIEDILAREYGILAVSVTDAPRGFVAETFVAEAANGVRYFVKWLPAWASADAMINGLAVAEELRAVGIDTVNNPLRTAQGKLSALLDGRTLAVFDFIEGLRGAVLDQRLGPSSFNYDFRHYVAMLARVHAATEEVRFPLEREDFSIPWAGEFEALLGQARDGRPVSDAQVRLQGLMLLHQAQMEGDWSKLWQLGEAARRGAWSPLLTHGDLLGDNVILGPTGALHFVDWDNPVLGPVERDAWFYLNDAEAAAVFADAYRETFPEFRPDPTRHHFYLYYRFFQDLWGYIEVVLNNPSHERQAWNMSELEKTCFEWLWPAMRKTD